MLCFVLLPLASGDGVHVEGFLPVLVGLDARHAVGRRRSPRGEVFPVHVGVHTIEVRVRKEPILHGLAGLLGVALPPVALVHVVADLGEPFPVDVLHGDAAIPDEYPRVLQLQRPQAEAVGFVAVQAPVDPAGDARRVVGLGVVPHGLGVGEDLKKGTACEVPQEV